MTRLGIALLAIAAALPAETTEELLFRARQAQLVEGDLDLAIRLFQKALEDSSLSRARQAEAHLRLAVCYDERKDYARAALHLEPALFADPAVGAEVRRRADELRAQVELKMPKGRPRPSRRCAAAIRANASRRRSVRREASSRAATHGGRSTTRRTRSTSTP
jgi:tetratricopeptide (TPR) repeat protein